jgi:predicted  nucleic acid-binding Zn-ribbon protein
MADTSMLVKFFTGSAKPATWDANGLYFIVNNGKGELYKGGTLIAETNDTAAISGLQTAVENINKALDTKATKEELAAHVALYDALLGVVNGHTTSIKANNDAITAIKDGAEIDSFADVETALAGKQAVGDYATKTEAQGYATNAASAVRTYVGELPADAGVETIVAYIQKLTSGIASEGTVSALATRVEQAEKDIDAVEAKLEGVTKVTTSISEAVTAEELRAKAAEEANAAAIAKKADQTALEAEAAAARAAEKANADAIAAVKEDVDFFFKDAGIDEENAQAYKDTLKEIQDYMNSDAQDAADLLAAINGVKGRMDTAEGEIDTLQSEMDAVEAKAAANEAAVATKAEQADLTAVKGRMDTAEGKITAAEGKITALETKVGEKAVATQIEEAIDALDIETYAKQADLTAEVTRAKGVEDTIIAALSWQTIQ